MTYESPTLMSRRLRCDAWAPSLAREEIRQLDLDDAAQADAALVVSELVTNAVRHSGCDATDEIEVTVEPSPTGVVISVWDIGRSGTAPAPRDTDFAAGGLGLRVVEALSRRWGTDADHGRRVWAEIAG